MITERYELHELLVCLVEMRAQKLELIFGSLKDDQYAAYVIAGATKRPIALSIIRQLVHGEDHSCVLSGLLRGET
jgi:hypothetical protein